MSVFFASYLVISKSMRNIARPYCTLAETKACTTLRFALSLFNAEEIGAIAVIIPMPPLSSQSFTCHVRHVIIRVHQRETSSAHGIN